MSRSEVEQSALAKVLFCPSRRRVFLAALLCLTFYAVPAAQAAHYKPCGNATVHGPYGMGWSDFHVKNTSCRVAVRTMRAAVARGGKLFGITINGWRITAANFTFMGRKGNARFRCFIYGVD